MSRSEPIRVLYMEDDPGTAGLVQKQLERTGYVVDLALDGAAGLVRCETGSYDVVVVAQTLPVLEGLEVLRCLCARGPLPPTIMVTGAGEEKIAAEALQLGVRDCLLKDGRDEYLEILPSVIARVLSQQQVPEEKRRLRSTPQECGEASRNGKQAGPLLTPLFGWLPLPIWRLISGVVAVLGRRRLTTRETPCVAASGPSQKVRIRFRELIWGSRRIGPKNRNNSRLEGVKKPQV